MNRNSSVKARIAISLLPKLNSCIYLPLIERCGGLEGFFSRKRPSAESALSGVEYTHGHF